MYELYQELLDKKGLKNADVAKATGVSNMTLSDWKRGKSVPKYKTMQKIAAFLNVTPEYLLNGEDTRIDAPEFSDDQFEVLNIYAQLNDKQKEAVLSMLRSMIL